MAKVVKKRISLIIFILSVILTISVVTRVQAVDTGLPQITSISPGDNAVINTKYASIQFTVNDPDDDIAIGTAFTNDGYSYTYNSPSLNDSFYIKIDGNLIPSRLQYSGHEEWNYDTSYWVVDSYKTATISGFINGLSETTHTVEVKTMDKSGNVITKSWSFTVGIPPTVSNISPAQGVTTNNNRTISATVTDDQLQPDSILMTVDGKLVPYSFDSITGKVTYNALTQLADGSHTVSITANDALGNNTTKSWSYYIYATPPQASFNYNNQTLKIDNPNLLVNLSSGQNLQNSGYVMKIDGAAVTPSFVYSGYDDWGTWVEIPTSATMSYNPSLLSDGNHTLEVIAYDVLGNKLDQTWNFTVAEPPSFSNITPVDKSVILNSVPTISADITDANGPAIDQSSIVLTVDGNSVTPVLTSAGGKVTVSYSSPNLADDTNHTVSLTAADTNGGSTTTNWSFYGALVSGVNGFSNFSPANGSVFNYSPQPIISAHLANLSGTYDINSRSMTISGYNYNQQLTPSVSGANPQYLLYYKPASPLLNGAYTTTVTVNNNGTPTTASWNFTVAVPPTFSNTYPKINVTTSSIPQITLLYTVNTSTKSLQKAVYSIDNGAEINATFDDSKVYINPFLSNNGNHTLTVKITDLTGQTATTSWNLVSDTLIGQSYTDMQVINDATCQSCHTNYYGSTSVHPLPAACSGCHSSKFNQLSQFQYCNACHYASSEYNTYFNGHPIYIPSSGNIVLRRHDVKDLHLSSTNNCLEGCHSRVLTEEHNGPNRTDLQNNPINCNTCHTNSDQQKQSAITNQNSNCSACHLYHQDNDQVHNTGFATNKQVDCSVCHQNALNLIHIGKPDSNNQAITCNTCHNTSRIDVKSAIQNNNTNCDACHSVHPDTDIKHTATYPSKPGMNCVDCHTKDVSGANNPMTLISNGHLGRKGSNGQLMTCNTCHTNTTYTHNGQTVKNIIGTYISNEQNNLPNPAIDCSTCHDIHPDNLETQHTTTYPTSNNLKCNDCHGTDNNNSKNPMNVLSTGHLGRKDNSGQTMTCGTCHNNTSFKVNGVGVKDYIAGIVNNNQEGNTNTIDCSNCHGDIHPNDVATPHTTIYPNLQNINCNQCHSKDKNNNNNPMNVISTGHINRNDSSGVAMNCASCHNNNTDYVFDSNGQQTSITIEQYIANYVHNEGLGSSQPAISCSLCHQVHNELNNPHKSTYIQNPTLDCSSCHQNTLQNEHLSRTDNKGNPIDCNTCHASKDPGVVNAILSKNTQCSACHNPIHGDVINQHNSTSATTAFPNSTLQCSDCHQSSLSEEHVTVRSLTCATCHNSTSTLVKSAIAAGNTNCSACHTVHPDINGAHQSTYIADPKVNCSSCHQNSLSSEHLTRRDKNGQAINCDTCHKSNKIEIKTAITDKNKSCDACHTSIHTQPSQLHTTDYMANPLMDCSSCHQSTLDSEHLKRVDRNGNPITCDTCHNSSDNKVKDTITNHLSTTDNVTKARCTECHTVHQNPDQLHNSKFVNNPTFNCANCHSNILNVEHSKHNLSCANCHNNKTKEVQQAIANRNINCDSCHVISHNNSTQADKIHTTSFIPNAQFNCAGCHKTTLSQEHLSRVKADGTTYNCNSCHNDVAANQVITEKASSKVKTSCNSCHQVHTNINDAHWKQYSYNPDSSCEGCHQIHPRKN